MFSSSLPSPSVEVHQHRIALGWYHGLMAGPQRGLYTWGTDEYDQLGRGGSAECKTPQPILELESEKILDVAAGNYHSLAVIRGGVLTWGRNDSGQLGHGDNVNRNTPKLILASTAIAVAAGYQHSMALTSNGKVYTWGGNSGGQLGIGPNGDQNMPQLVKNMPRNIIAIEAGCNHCFAVTSGGELYSWGRNLLGQLGLGDNVDKNTPQRVLGELASKRVIAVAAGTVHSMVIACDRDGTRKVYACGCNSDGQLGMGVHFLPGHGNDDRRYRFQLVHGLSDKNIIAIAAGHGHSITLAENGSFFTSGSGFGIGDKSETSQLQLEPYQRVFGETNDIEIAANLGRSLVLYSKEGVLYTAGSDSFGQLGLRNIKSQHNLTAMPFPNSIGELKRKTSDE